MKKILFVLFTLLACSSFAQTAQENGIIYKEHPYITIVNHSTELFLKQDWDAMAKLYTDTAKFYDLLSPKSFNLETAKNNWAAIYNDWEQITVTRDGYPDGLKYAKDPFTVQSWWKVTCVNKKTKKKAIFSRVQFDEFNKDGKISAEEVFYDRTSIIEASK